MRPERLDRGLHDLRVAGEAQVVVGAEVEDPALRARHAHHRALLPADHALRLPSTRL